MQHKVEVKHDEELKRRKCSKHESDAEQLPWLQIHVMFCCLCFSSQNFTCLHMEVIQ